MAKSGYYQPYFILGAAITAISGGLTYTFDMGKQVGYQILMGFGTGLVLQIPPISGCCGIQRRQSSWACSCVE